MNVGVCFEGSAVRKVGDLSPTSWVQVRYHWDKIETQPGVYDWTALDIDASALRGHSLLYQVTGTPEWYRDSPYICSPPTKLNAPRFYQFVAAMASRYHPPAIEIWNEPNIPAELTPRPDLFGGFGMGKARYYGKLLAGAHEAIHHASPGTLVIGGALSKVDKFWQKAMKKAECDAVSYHCYPQFTTQFNFALDWGMELRRMGETRPLWISETSYLYDISTPYAEGVQADYLSYIARLGGIVRAFWYTLKGNGWRHSDLIEGTRRKPAWDVYYSQMDGH